MSDDRSLLAQEYIHLQKIIEDFDGKTLTVKAWSVTFSAAAIGFAYDKQQPVLLIVSMVSAIAFWFVEALLKVNQHGFFARIRAIEVHFAGGEVQAPFQISRSWYASFRAAGAYARAFRVMGWAHVAMPHAAIAAVAGALLIFSHPAAAAPTNGATGNATAPQR